VVHRRRGFENFLTLAETTLPKVLPRRYGKVEPPQYKYEIQGRKHFVSLMQQEDFDLVWYPYDPVADGGRVPGVREARPPGFDV
jgi:hypothetical protein